MSKFIKIIDDEHIEISDYRNPNAVFKNREYADYDSLCIFKEVINPFVLYGENKQLKNQLQQKENIIKELKERSLQYIEEIDRLLDIKNEVRDILKRHICNPSGLKDGWHIDCWNNEDISKLNEDLGILDKEKENG